MSDRVKRIAVLQRICASYRVDLFSALGKVENVDFKLFIGRDIPGTKVKGVSGSPGVNAKELETKFVKLGRKIFPIHLGLVRELKKFRPTVVLCEGESHFLGYLQAIYYQLRYDRRGPRRDRGPTGGRPQHCLIAVRGLGLLRSPQEH